MRVIAGTGRGKKLIVPPGVETRPTADRVKEALFSILASRIDFTDIDVLDICAGTGSLGIEALSRGAGSCCFIENNPSVKAILEKNLLATCCQSQSEIILMDAVKALNMISRRGKCYDLVFFDPPYDSELYVNVFEALNSPGLLTPGSIMVAECSVRNQLSESYGCLKRFDRRVYGETALELFALEE
ncbi:MAG: 16S rRNA (guanine(966)-N(2))-methyltransferase RsmD [Geobacteraceae bacterium]|nr:16S rRNA (guanine(966)-N(2))-methyltransferase RsmD [Geobacteraceae bacterium]NTW80955.1 16S rRNA (guanine(966)-N(2))-methyltransferase RsmD [Geobacteraceae bacterium]